MTATRAAVMEQGRSGNLVEQFEAWAQSLLGPGAIELAYTYDQGTLDSLGRRPTGRPG